MLFCDSSARMSAVYTLEEVAKHKSSDDLWIVIDGNVYDVTDYVEEHPGGADLIEEEAGNLNNIIFYF